MDTMQQLSAQFNMDELTQQLHDVVASKDPVGYMKNNINWEIDNDVDDTGNSDNMMNIAGFLSTGNEFFTKAGYESWNPFKKFLDWFSRNKVAKKVKKILCGIADEIKKLIDEEAKLKEILTIALAAIATAIGIGAINPLLLTVLVGLLATMILKGVDAVCAV
jgi:hypothetical protein